MKTAKTIIDIRPADTRFKTKLDWLDGRHSFSFGHHWDENNTHHGLLVVSNEDRVQPSSGFSTHPHRDMEIVTWMISGEIEHQDSMGNRGKIYPGLAQRMSAGTGVYHSEMNPSPKTVAHLVQMWVLPDTKSLKPSYEQRDISQDLAKGGMVLVASGSDELAPIRINQKNATLWAARLNAGKSVNIPKGPYVHLFVAVGSGNLGPKNELQAGDAARLTDVDNLTWTAGPKGCEILIWQMLSGMP